MEIGQLEAFLEVARLGSFTRAAQNLYLTQPSLSARIHALEREIGESLFHRMGRGVRLTDAGRALLPYVERALDTLKSGKEALEASQDASSGKLHIGSARIIGTYVLPDILDAFHRRYPGIDVTIKTGRSFEVLEMVVSEEVQVGLTRSLVHSEIESIHLYDEEIVLVTHPDHPFAIRGEASIYEVGHQPLILYDKESTYFVLIDRVCREAGILPNVKMNLDSVEATKHMLERGLGISFLPKNSIHLELERQTLAEIKLSGGYEVKLPTSIMVRRSKSYSAPVLAFLEVLQQIYEMPMPFLDGHRGWPAAAQEVRDVNVSRR